MTMRITRAQIRRICEQVLGYTPPKPAGSQKDDYLATGSTMTPVGPDSEEDTQAMDSDIRKLTQQRQDQLDKGETVDAEDTGRQLQDIMDKKNQGAL